MILEDKTACLNKLKVCIINADEIDLDLPFHVNELSDEDFYNLAEKQHQVFFLADFIEAFNNESIHVSSTNSFLRIL